jgi:hypothetical protein
MKGRREKRRELDRTTEDPAGWASQPTEEWIG